MDVRIRKADDGRRYVAEARSAQTRKWSCAKVLKHFGEFNMNHFARWARNQGHRIVVIHK